MPTGITHLCNQWLSEILSTQFSMERLWEPWEVQDGRRFYYPTVLNKVLSTSLRTWKFLWSWNLVSQSSSCCGGFSPACASCFGLWQMIDIVRHSWEVGSSYWFIDFLDKSFLSFIKNRWNVMSLLKHRDNVRWKHKSFD